MSSLTFEHACLPSSFRLQRQSIILRTKVVRMSVCYFMVMVTVEGDQRTSILFINLTAHVLVSFVGTMSTHRWILIWWKLHEFVLFIYSRIYNMLIKENMKVMFTNLCLLVKHVVKVVFSCKILKWAISNHVMNAVVSWKIFKWAVL